MPLYEYRCEGCGRPEECLESFSAPDSHDCASCGAKQGMRRQLSVAAFALAGSGWYKGAAKAPAESAPSAPADPPKSGHACGSGGCGCSLAG